MASNSLSQLARSWFSQLLIAHLYNWHTSYWLSLSIALLTTTFFNIMSQQTLLFTFISSFSPTWPITMGSTIWLDLVFLISTTFLAYHHQLRLDSLGLILTIFIQLAHTPRCLFALNRAYYHCIDHLNWLLAQTYAHSHLLHTFHVFVDFILHISTIIIYHAPCSLLTRPN